MAQANAIAYLIHYFFLYWIVSMTLAQSAFGDSSTVQQRTVTQIASGVYVIRHKDAPNGFPQGNTTVIIGDSDVLVVDSCYLPSSATEDIEQIKQWTNKPVRYLLNTHWHADHTRGNGVYQAAFPGITIISQIATRELIKGFYADHPENASAIVKRDVAIYKRYLDVGKTDDGTPLGEDDKKEIKAVLAGADVVSAEFTSLVPVLPGVTFDKELDIDLGHRPVHIMVIGRGHTAGDVIAILPDSETLIAGDLVVHPGPYTGSGLPSEWIVALNKIITMNPKIIVPGHGEVLHDTSYVSHLVEYATTVVQQVKEQYYLQTNRATLDDVKKGIDMAALRNRFGPYFKDDAQNGAPYLDLDGLIKVAYEEIQPR
jgi:glyoxylase-like metal-dependent hydrolase (beta-lactamase superfamily II)